MLMQIDGDYRTWCKVITRLPQQHQLGTLWPLDPEHKRFLDERTHDWCWQAQPGYNVIYIRDKAVAMLFKLMFGIERD
jgi:hypothetical protein